MKNKIFIKSRLANKRALKMGLSSLNHKKGRLLVIIFLLVVSLTIFSFLFATKLIKDSTIASELANKSINSNFLLINNTVFTNKEDVYNESKKISDFALNNGAKKINFVKESNNLDFDKIKFSNYFKKFDKNEHFLYQNYSYVKDFLIFDEDSYELIEGEKLTGKNQIYITKALYEAYKEFGINNADGFKEVKKISDIVNHEIKYGDKTLIIKGVVKFKKDYIIKIDNKIFNANNFEDLVNLDSKNKNFFNGLLSYNYVITKEFSKEIKDTNKEMYNIKNIDDRFIVDKDFSDEKNSQKNLEEKLKTLFSKNRAINSSDYVGLRPILNEQLSFAYAFFSVIIPLVSKPLLIANIIFLLFTMLLFSFYISSTIKNKTKDIGILRALGARGIDVYKIFLTESLILGLISSIISSVVLFIIKMLINRNLQKGIEKLLDGNNITFYHSRFEPYLVIFLISTVVAIIASFIPIYMMSRKKPVEVIRKAD